MRKNVIVTLAVVATLAVAVAVFAGSLTGWGSQTRGQGSNATLAGEAFTLPATATVAGVDGDGAGFWIQNSGGVVVRNFDANGAATGFQLAAGTYYLYPNLKQGQNFAKVRVTFNW